MKELSMKEFAERVKSLHFFQLKALKDFEIESMSMTGCFYKKDLPYLLEYCETHPEYHISTTMGGNLYEYNQVVDHGLLFFLCAGDDDPTLFTKPDWGSIGPVLILISKFVRGEATPAEIYQLKHGIYP